MKSAYLLALVALCAVLSSGTALRLDRGLKQQQVVTSSSSSTALAGPGGIAIAISRVDVSIIRQASRAIAGALATAINNISGGGNVRAEADAFAQAVATAYVAVVFDHYAFVLARGNAIACVEGTGFGQGTASAMAEATASAFATASNADVRAEASAMASAVATATARVQAHFANGGCVTQGRRNLSVTLIEGDFATAVAIAAARALAVVRDGVGSSSSDSGSVAIGGK